MRGHTPAAKGAINTFASWGEANLHCGFASSTLVNFPAEVAAAAKSKDVCGWPCKQTSNQPAEFCVPRILHCPQATLAGSFHLPAFSKKKDFPRLKPNKLGSPVSFLERENIQSDTFNLVSLDFVVVKRLLSFYLDSHFFTVGHTALCIRLTLLHCGFLLVWVKAASEWFISSSHCQWQMGSKAFPWRTLSTPRGSLS